jgi:beta-phosphoglucomutase
MKMVKLAKRLGKMQWIHQFQLFLFDFDGLLVDTEPFHYLAYKEVLQQYDCHIQWDLQQYCALAHKNSTALCEATYQAFPHLLAQQPDWEELRKQRKKLYIQIIETRALQLMPGAQQLLEKLQDAEMRHCVVTNSTAKEVTIIQEKLPVLQKIPLWVTREKYEKAKPNPESYLKAIDLLGRKEDRIVGFEDSLKGFNALQGTPATPVLVVDSEHVPPGIFHFSSLESIPSDYSFCIHPESISG